MTDPEQDDSEALDYDSLDEDAQDAMRAKWEHLVEQRLASLDLGAVFEAEGRPYAVLSGDGRVIVRGAEGLHRRD